MNLFVFPFAGGSSYSFEFLKRNGLSGIHVLDYPGRGKKLAQPLLYTSESIVDSLYNELKERLNGPYCFYGHSMGTLIGYLLIKKLKENNQILPMHLFVSGRGGPSHALDETRHNLPKDQFWQRIKELGGCPKEVLENSDLMDFFEPILRADLQSIEMYIHDQDSEPLEIPITLLLGDEDKVKPEEALLWQNETLSTLDVRYYKGGHFFILDHAKEIAELIGDKMNTLQKNKL